MDRHRDGGCLRDNLLDHFTGSGELRPLMMDRINPALLFHLLGRECFSFAIDVGDWDGKQMKTNDENCYLRRNNKVVNVTELLMKHFSPICGVALSKISLSVKRTSEC